MKRILLVVVLFSLPLTAASASARTMRVTSTAYCLRGMMANGQHTHAGAVAMNILPLGRRIHVNRSPYGARSFVVKDHIGWGTQLDFWVSSCAQARAWGRRGVTVRY